MQSRTAHAIVEEVLARDLDPPDPEFCLSDFGLEVAEQIDGDLAVAVVRECLRRLPGTTSESFLEGLLERADIEDLDELLVGCIATASDTGVGSSIWRLLEHFCGLSPSEIAGRVVEQLRRTRDADGQNRLSFTLWSLICGETYDIPAGVLKWNSRVMPREELAELLETLELSKYARETIQQCLEQGDFGDRARVDW